jgi:hypothetical protein
METFHKLPNEPFYEDIDAYLKVWLYESWRYKLELESEKERNQAIFLGSFSNYEMAVKMVKAENPDMKTTDFEATTQMVREQIIESEKASKNKRKKRKVVG